MSEWLLGFRVTNLRPARLRTPPGGGALVMFGLLMSLCQAVAAAKEDSSDRFFDPATLQTQPGMTCRYRVYAVLPTPGGPRGKGVSNVITVSVPDHQPMDN